MKAIILGSKGFIGSSIRKMFVLESCIAIDDINLLSDLLLVKCDVIINCAGASNVPQSFIDSTNDFERNVLLVKNILERIRLSGNRNIRFVNLSSAAVYGNPKNLPTCETDMCRPISPYGSHKLMAEELCRYYHNCFEIKTLSLRIFSAYGNGQKKLLLWDLHQKIQNSNGNLVLFGTGKESRDFIHIEDIAQQIILAIDHADFDGGAINVANGVEVEISEVVELYQRYYPQKFNYEFNGEERLGDPKNWCADMSMMRNWDYQSRVGIEQGIKNYINWAVRQLERD